MRVHQGPKRPGHAAFSEVAVAMRRSGAARRIDSAAASPQMQPVSSQVKSVAVDPGEVVSPLPLW